MKRHEQLRDVIKQSCSVAIGAKSCVRTTQGITKRRHLSLRATSSELTQRVAVHPTHHYADAFEALDGIMSFMYGAELVEKYRHCVGDYKRAIEAIGCSVTVSMHMLVDHDLTMCDKHG